MNKYLFCLLLNTLLFGHLISQDNIKYEVSPPYEYIETPIDFSNYEPNYNFTNADTSKTLLIKKYGGYLDLQLFDNESMAVLNRTRFNTKEKINATFISTISRLGDKLYCFYSRKEYSKYNFLCREISLDSCDFLGEEIELFSTSERLEAGWRFICRTSKDKSKLLVFYRLQNTLNKEKLSFFLFNKELDELARTQIEMPHSSTEATYIQCLLDNQANLYILRKILLKNTSISKFKSFCFELYNVDFSLDSLKKIELPSQEYLITDIALSKKNKETLICTGFYTKKNIELDENQYFLKKHIYVTGITGLFFFEINSNKITYEKSYEIPETSYNIYGTERRSKLKNLKFRHLVYQADSSFLLIGEQLRSPYSGIQHRERTVFLSYEYMIKCNDILAIKFDSNKEISWIKRLPKKQESKNKVGDKFNSDMSFNYQYIQGSHYFMFIDNVKNLNIGVNKKPKWHVHARGGFFTFYRLDDLLGTVSKESLFELDRIQIEKGVNKKYKLSLFNIHQAIRTSDSSLMIEFYKKKEEDVLVKINLN